MSPRTCRSLEPKSAAEFGRLRELLWPYTDTLDEIHDELVRAGF